MQGIWVNEPQDKEVAVVFVHGVLSSSDAGWRNEHGNTWPALLKEGLGDTAIAIYTYTYNTSLGSGGYSIDNAADVLQTLFNLDGLARFRHVVFVCHSMGGIVARRFLVRRHYEYPDIDFSFFLVASPTQGSDFANWLAPIGKLLGHAQVDALRVSQTNPWLTSLNSDFAGIVESRRIRGRELVEDKSIFPVAGLFRKAIVNPLSAGGLFPDPLKIPASDHFSISKPDGQDALQHRVLLAFIQKILESTRRAESARVAPTTIHLANPQTTAATATQHPSLVNLQSLQELILLATEAEKVAFIQAIAYGPGLNLCEVSGDIITSYGDALRGMHLHLLAATAARLVITADPLYKSKPRLIAVLPADLPPENNPSPEIVYAMFQLAALKGPRMLAALLLCAPQQAVSAAGQDIQLLLRKLSGEV
jgi:hypothetical protein